MIAKHGDAWPKRLGLSPSQSRMSMNLNTNASSSKSWSHNIQPHRVLEPRPIGAIRNQEKAALWKSHLEVERWLPSMILCDLHHKVHRPKRSSNPLYGGVT